ncbi:MAG: secondary thiamine-phosphate synthase enzyme YjbQ [Dehalococcoides sp.]
MSLSSMTDALPLYRLEIPSHSQTEFIDITPQIRSVIHQSGITSGLCLIFVPHTTAGLTINENADPDVITDIKAQLERIVPSVTPFLHAEGNSAAHVKTSLMGNSLNLIIEEGMILLGTWQGIYLAEFDGPRKRTVNIKILKEK